MFFPYRDSNRGLSSLWPSRSSDLAIPTLNKKAMDNSNNNNDNDDNVDDEDDDISNNNNNNNNNNEA